MRTFVKLRDLLSAHKELAQRLRGLESKLNQHYEDIRAISGAIAELMAPTSPKPEHPAGFGRE